MTYRRDARVNTSYSSKVDPQNSITTTTDQMPLPIETIYNSYKDAVTNVESKTGDETYFQNGLKHFNRIYFKYPPEWQTSDVGEKIIGVRNMKFSIRKCVQLRFNLYIRKYRQDKFNELAKELYRFPYKMMDDEQIQDVVDRMDREDIHVYKIEYCNDIFDNIDDFIEDLYDKIEEENLYNKLHNDIVHSDQNNEEKIAALEQLDADADNYDIMRLRNNIPFYLSCRNDIVIEEDIGDEIMLTIKSTDNPDFYLDFLITTKTNNTYKKFYMWDYEKNEPLPYQVEFPKELNGFDRFDFDTANYFNIGTTNPNRNSLEYVTKFHKELELKNIMTNLQCEVAASFASQSNHNLIGRTNEDYTPIKYYKIKDNDDMFWIEFYDKNEIDVPVAFNDFVMFTMDVVFLQNRKLLYS